jgi:hypothetical protein
VKLKLIIAYTLLASFFVLLTPRKIWHDCDHHKVIDSSEIHFDKDECYACDFSLSVVSQPQVFTYYFIKAYFTKFDLTLSSLYFKKKFEHFPHRGPPTSIFIG